MVFLWVRTYWFKTIQIIPISPIVWFYVQKYWWSHPIFYPCTFLNCVYQDLKEILLLLASFLDLKCSADVKIRNMKQRKRFSIGLDISNFKKNSMILKDFKYQSSSAQVFTRFHVCNFSDMRRLWPLSQET